VSADRAVEWEAPRTSLALSLVLLNSKDKKTYMVSWSQDAGEMSVIPNMTVGPLKNNSAPP
jgi:hypothetical protein